MADIIKVEHLSYVYNPGMPNAVTALDDVSFTVEEGDFVGIIGATGSGKSTLITHMNGLNKPTSGKIYIDGRDLWEDPEKIRDFRFLTGSLTPTFVTARPVGLAVRLAYTFTLIAWFPSMLSQPLSASATL